MVTQQQQQQQQATPQYQQAVPGVNVPVATDPTASLFGTIATNAPTVGTTGPGAQPGLPGGGSQQPIFPGSSLSPYYLSQIGTSQVELGASFPSGGAMTIDAAINFFDSLPPSELQYFETLLNNAGFYTDANGNPLKTASVSGTLDDQSRRAWVNALIAAFSSGQSVTDTINNAIQSGQGAELRSTLPGAVMGGGNVYTIDLTQPGAVNQIANTMAEQLIGRRATQSELANITNAINSQTITQGLAKEQGAELSSQQQYQARMNQRNIAFQFETNQKAALGPVPSGQITSTAQYATTLLQYMNKPVTASNVAFLMGWMKAQGGDLSTMNPFGTQNVVPGSQPGQGATPTYTSWAQSLYATASGLLPYTNIMAALTNGDASSQTGNKDLQAELGKWSSGGYTDISGQVKSSQGQANTASQGVLGNQAPLVGYGIPQNVAQGLPGFEAFIKGGGTPAQWDAALSQQQAGVPAQQVGTAPFTGSTTPANAVALPGQQQSNPGDQYVNPTTVFSQNPLSPEQASYLEYTTGANRFSYAENNYLNAFLSAMNMIKAGGPTGTA